MGSVGGRPLGILLVKLSAVGDVVHTLPALAALRECFPEAKLGWVAHPGPASLLENHPQLDFLFHLPRPRHIREAWHAVRELREVVRRAGPWDVAIDFQGLTKSGVVAWLSGAPRRIGFAGAASRELNALFMTERIAPRSKAVIEMNLELVAALGCSGRSASPVLVAHPQDEQVIREWARQEKLVGQRFFILDAFAGWPTKRWPLERWGELASAVFRRHGLPPLVFYGPGEIEEARHLAETIRQLGAPAVLAPPTTLREYIALLRQHAAIVAGGDTGPMHMAAALGVPTLALFGSSDSRRNAPIFPGAIFELLQDFRQPCAGTFWRTCPHHPPGHCLDGITVAEAVAAVERLWERAWSRVGSERFP